MSAGPEPKKIGFPLDVDHGRVRNDALELMKGQGVLAFASRSRLSQIPKQIFEDFLEHGIVVEDPGTRAFLIACGATDRSNLTDFAMSSSVSDEEIKQNILTRYGISVDRLPDDLGVTILEAIVGGIRDRQT